MGDCKYMVEDKFEYIDKCIKECIEKRECFNHINDEKIKVMKYFLERNKYEDNIDYIDYLINLELNKRIEVICDDVFSLSKFVSNVYANLISIKIPGKILDEHINKKDINYKLESNKELRFKLFLISRYRVAISELINKFIEEKIPLIHLKCVLTARELIMVIDELKKEKLNEYLEYMIEFRFFENRQPLKFFALVSDVFWNPSQLSHFTRQFNEYKAIYEYIKGFVSSKEQEYYERLVSSNKSQISLLNDKWTLVEGDYIENTFKYFDFSQIKSDDFKYEVKLYMMERVKESHLGKINSLSLIVPCVNFLYENDNECNSFGNIDMEDAMELYLHLTNIKSEHTGDNYTASTISKIIGEIRKVSNFLIRYQKNNYLKTVTIENNYFENINFRNIHNMHKKTSIIPDEVIAKIIEHEDELNEIHRVIFDVFINTGMRLKQVLELKADCLEYSPQVEGYMLNFYESKNRNYAKTVSRDPIRQLLIPNPLVEEIREQQKRSESIRTEYNKDYLFLRIDKEKGKLSPQLISGKGFTKQINSIIKKYNITDGNGELWNFTTRQIRKTIVVNMIENGATKAEIAYVLGHFNLQTLERYYAEVEQKRIDDMNNEFFKDKFRINVGEENLKQFSEKERKVLYIDFITNYRRTELGYCSKHYSEGVCGKFVGGSKCSKCNKLCTGSDFKNKWIELSDSAKKEIEKLEKFYDSHNIPYETYKDFREYEVQVNNLKVYEDVLSKI